MRINSLEIQNFRKLESTCVDFDIKQTLLVGANNSGKTSAMIALRYFFIDQSSFSSRDISIGNWGALNEIGLAWESQEPGKEVANAHIVSLLPAMDVWLDVKDEELHHIAHLIPNLDWQGGCLGVRMRLEPRSIEQLRAEYLADREAAKTVSNNAIGIKAKSGGLLVWPNDFLQFLEKRLCKHFVVRSYVLDPDKRQSPKKGKARPQDVPVERVPIEGDPWKGLIRIDEIAAQRDLSDAEGTGRNEFEGQTDKISRKQKRRLSEQLRAYYNRHLDPTKAPTEADIDALAAIQSAEAAFDERLKIRFEEPIKELEALGYPGVSDPKVMISTRLRATDGLQHASARAV